MRERKYENSHKEKEEKASDISAQMANLTTQRAVIMVLLTLLLPAVANPDIIDVGDANYLVSILGVSASLYGVNISNGSTAENLTKAFLNASITEFTAQYPDVYQVHIYTAESQDLLKWDRPGAHLIEPMRRVSKGDGKRLSLSALSISYSILFCLS